MTRFSPLCGAPCTRSGGRVQYPHSLHFSQTELEPDLSTRTGTRLLPNDIFLQPLASHLYGRQELCLSAI